MTEVEERWPRKRLGQGGDRCLWTGCRREDVDRARGEAPEQEPTGQQEVGEVR